MLEQVRADGEREHRVDLLVACSAARSVTRWPSAICSSIRPLTWVELAGQDVAGQAGRGDAEAHYSLPRFVAAC